MPKTSTFYKRWSMYKRWVSWHDALHNRLSRPDAKIQSALLGLISGLICGGVIIIFRLVVEYGQTLFLSDNNPENFESLHWLARLLFPTLGGTLIGIIFVTFARGNYVVGVIHVIERLAYFQGHMHWRSFFMQFIGAVLALVSGHSIGREGPIVHLGAASSSLLGQRIGVPNNTLRTLIGCGAAAAIGASFNTPLAGVIFAMEVVLLEYRLISFIPIILAAVSATSLSIAAFGDDPLFNIPVMSLSSLKELPFVIFLGLLTGIVSSIFIKALSFSASKAINKPFILRTTLAGFIVGLCAIIFPQVMGVGYDTIDKLLVAPFPLWILAGVLLFKLIATVASISLGIPGGLIGPSLFIGAMLGGITGKISFYLFPDIAASEIGVYVLLGMGACMAAVLQAPLAALTALLELTQSPSIIFPGMLVIVIAELTRSELLNLPSAFRALLQARGLDYQANPMTQYLYSIGVASMMERKFTALEEHCSLEQAHNALKKEPKWLVITAANKPINAMPAADLARFLQQEQSSENETIDLLEIPAHRESIAGIHQRATLKEAADQLEKTNTELLYVYDTPAASIERIKGLLKKQTIESAYRA